MNKKHHSNVSLGIGDSWKNISNKMKKQDIESVYKLDPTFTKSYSIGLKVNNELLLLKRKLSYEFVTILIGKYSRMSLYKDLHAITKEELNMLYTCNITEMCERFPFIKEKSYQYIRLERLLELVKEIHHLIDGNNSLSQYAFPSGKKESREGNLNTALRELCEETSLIIPDNVIDNYYVITTSTISNLDDVYSQTIFVYDVKEDTIDLSKLTLSEEYCDMDWISIDNVDKITPQHVREAARYILSN
jgi:8-oxo-dGTP pyrophosphatase MutT (NUDIX family)